MSTRARSSTRREMRLPRLPGSPEHPPRLVDPQLKDKHQIKDEISGQTLSYNWSKKSGTGRTKQQNEEQEGHDRTIQNSCNRTRHIAFDPALRSTMSSPSSLSPQTQSSGAPAPSSPSSACPSPPLPQATVPRGTSHAPSTSSSSNAGSQTSTRSGVSQMCRRACGRSRWYGWQGGGDGRGRSRPGSADGSGWRGRGRICRRRGVNESRGGRWITDGRGERREVA